MHDIHISRIKRINKRVQTTKNMRILFSEQALWSCTKVEKGLLDDNGK